jgi:signal transduction histidine kinase
MERLLQSERLRKAGKKPEIDSVNIRTLLRGEARRFEKQAEAKGLKLVVDVPLTLEARSDPELITLVLQNFIGNAIKYSNKGTVWIRAKCEDGSSRCTISVTDEGPGIAHEHLGRIFEAFKRGEGHGQIGVGLGLAIASQAAKLLGAEIRVESTIGVGSTFTLILPPSRQDGSA